METILKRCEKTLDGVGTTKIPKQVWKHCKGVAIINVTEIGFVFSLGEGDGIVVKHNDDGTWGAPSAVMFTGGGAGAVFGKGNKQILLFPMTEYGLKMLCANTKYDIGIQLGVAAGPVGREAALDAGAGGTGAEVVLAYVFENGVFLNVGMNNSFLDSVDSANKAFYGKKVEPVQIVDSPGAVTIPTGKGVEDFHSKLNALSK